MPSSDLLRRLEALNGGPLREAATVEEETAADGVVSGGEAIGESAPRRQTRRSRDAAVHLADVVPGAERMVEGRPYYHVERTLADEATWCSALGSEICAALPGVRSGRSRRSLTPPKPHELVFVDVETLGLDMASPIFLTGFVLIDSAGRAVCRQILARTLDEERAALTAATQVLAEAKLIVSFNGRSYDLPLMRSRAESHGVPFMEPPAHVDMLLEARRRYSRKLPNCRLQTLEERVCGRTREDDVPSNRIPGVYRQFTKTGDACQLRKVIHHNLLDLATTAELFTLFFR